MMQGDLFGARLERGEVVEVGTSRQVKVASLDRPGIVSRFMYPFENATYAVGTQVFYWMFEDGTGIVLGKAYVHPSTRVINNQRTST